MVARQAGPTESPLTETKATLGRLFRVFLAMPADLEPIRVVLTHDPSAILTSLPVGVLLKFTILAANSSGESLPSETVKITLD